MIDDVEKATELVAKIKAELPIFVYPTNSLRKSMIKNNNIQLKSTTLMEIKDVLYLGDEGGIGCTIQRHDSRELLIVSITHLRIKDKQPLAKEIKRYQLNRRRALLEP